MEVEHAGCSYNPDAEQHQDALAGAVAHVVQQKLGAELAPKVLLRLADLLVWLVVHVS